MSDVNNYDFKITWGCTKCGAIDAKPDAPEGLSPKEAWAQWEADMRSRGWVLVSLVNGRSTGYCGACVSERDPNRAMPKLLDAARADGVKLGFAKSVEWLDLEANHMRDVGDPRAEAILRRAAHAMRSDYDGAVAASDAVNGGMPPEGAP